MRLLVPKTTKVIELLDISCAKALDAWWEKDIRCKERSNTAMTELRDKLRSLSRPDYDCEYIPPAYVIRYQISHILMARRTLSWIDANLKDRWGVGAGRRELLRIVDFGAGTSAGRIGAALMAAKALEDGRSIDHIYIDEIDNSFPMLEMGEWVWQAFTQEVQSKFADSALAYAVKVIHPSQHREWSNVKDNYCETWLTAFHVTYHDQNRDDEKNIKTLYQQVGPVAGVFSCFYKKDKVGGDRNLPLMKAVFPFDKCNPPCEIVADSSRCETAYVAKRAVHYGFTKCNYYQKPWRPYLSVDCALLFGGSSRKLGAENKDSR